MLVALIDLDGFKAVNDIHGHAAGDRLLAEVGRRLAAQAGDTVTVARLGGDEFAAILSGNPGDADMAAFGPRLCAVLQGPYWLGDIVADVSGSVGLVVYPDGGETAEMLFERADYAMYYAKQTRTGQSIIFSHTHEAMIHDAVRLELALRHADFEQEMWLAFQPLVDASTGRTVGFEALARWNSPSLGPVGPDLFIPVAERAGLIGKLTGILLAKALQAAATWPETMRIAFNLSAHDVVAPGILATVRRIVASSGVAPNRIDLEITETAILRDFAVAADTLKAFQRAGYRISLDDFGTGYSSLSHVHRLKPQKIKIDRSFVAGIREDQASRSIVRTIVDLCRNLDMECVVEGVETEAQMHILRALGCRIMQGYLFGRPMPAGEVTRFLASEREPTPPVVPVNVLLEVPALQAS
jgi:diguanylate cyclase (GGDEF)-like protein